MNSAKESNWYEIFTDMQLSDLWALACAERDWCKLHDIAEEIKRRRESNDG